MSVFGFFLIHSSAFPALSIGGLDFEIAGLEEKWQQLHPSIQSKILNDKAAEEALISFHALNNLFDQSLDESIPRFLTQVMQIESYYAAGKQDQQDHASIKGFKNQVKKTLALRQELDLILRRQADQFFSPSEEEKIQLGQRYVWLMNHLPDVEALRKNIAHYFFTHRVGYNPHHDDTAQELTWISFSKIKIFNILAKFFLAPKRFDSMSCIYRLIEDPQAKRNILTRKNITDLNPALLAGTLEFQVEESTPFDLTQIQKFGRHSQHLFSILWQGDNETASLPDTPLGHGTIQAFFQLNKHKELDNVLKNAFLRNVFHLISIGNNVSKHELLPQGLRDIWVHHALGRPLYNGEKFPHQNAINLILMACQYCVPLNSILKDNDLDKSAITRLYHAIQARFPQHAKNYKDTYMNAIQQTAAHYNKPSATHSSIIVLSKLRSFLNLDEFENHPECVVWKLTQGPNPQAAVLGYLQYYNELIMSTWILNRSQQVSPSPLNLVASDQKNVNYWTESYENAQKASQNNEKLAKCLKEIVFEHLPFQYTRDAINRQILGKKIYEVITTFRKLVQKSNNDCIIFLKNIVAEENIIEEIQILSINFNLYLTQLDNLPHWKTKLDNIKMIMETIFDKGLSIPHQTFQIFELSKSLTAYSQHMDLRYFEAVTRLWWTKRFSFLQSEVIKEYEDSLIFEQFCRVHEMKNINPIDKETWLKEIWNATEKKARIEDYLPQTGPTSWPRSHSI